MTRAAAPHTPSAAADRRAAHAIAVPSARESSVCLCGFVQELAGAVGIANCESQHERLRMCVASPHSDVDSRPLHLAVLERVFWLWTPRCHECFEVMTSSFFATAKRS